MSEYKYLKIKGPISLQPELNPVPVLKSIVILLLGLTGVGKSNFLECLSSDAELKISGDSLESVTQDITLYKLLNVKYETRWKAKDLYLIDCPGFSDNDLSEFTFVKMLQRWIQSPRDSADKKPYQIDVILYFHRITDKRLAGSHRSALKLTKSLVGASGENLLLTGVITTMWDTLWNDTQRDDAEKRFQQLQRDILKDALGPRAASASRFHNTQASALQILDHVYDITAADFPAAPHRWFSDPPLVAFHDQKFREAPFAQQLYELLEERISRLEQKLRILEETANQPDTHSANPEVVNALLKDKKDVEDVLTELKREREEFQAIMMPEHRPNIARRMIKYVHDKLP